MDANKAQADLDKFRDTVFDVADDSVAHCVAPVVQIEGDKDIIDCRSAVLLQIADMKFLVTAGHDMVKYLTTGQPSFLVMPKPEMHPIQLFWEHFWTTKDSNEDLSVTQLDPSTVQYIGDTYRFLRLSDLMSRHDRCQGNGFYLLLGFPNARYEYDEEKKIRANTWKYKTVWYRKNFADVTNYDPSKHLIVEYERDTKISTGQRIHPPGLSGCGIWWVGNSIYNPVFRSESFKLVGIQTAWHEGRQYAKCTWIDIVMRIIWEYYPQARAPMALNGIEF